MPITPWDSNTAGSSSGSVTSVNGKTGAVSVSKNDVGLGNVENFSTATMPVPTSVTTAIAAEHAAMVAQVALCLKNADKGAASGVAPLNASGKLSSSYLDDSITSGLKWQSTYNASTGLPTIAVPSASTAGYFWKVDTAGTQTINGTSFTLQIGDWLVNNSTATQKIANTLVSATTTQQGTIILAGDLQNTYDAPRVKSLQGVAVPAAAPTAAGQYLRSTSTSATEYASIPATDLPTASTAAKGCITIGGDLAGTGTAQTVAKVNGWSVANEPNSVNQVLAVTDVANKTLGYVAQSGGGGLAAEYLFAKLPIQNTGLSNGSNLLYNTVQTSAGSAISLNTSTGVFTLLAGRVYRLRGYVPYTVFSGTDGYTQIQWYDITNSAYIGTTGAGVSVQRAISEGKVCLYEAVIAPSVTTQVAAKFTATGGVYQLTSINDASASVEVISGSSPVTGQSVEYATVKLAAGQTPSVGAYVNFQSAQVVGNIPCTNGVFTLSAGKTYRLTGWAAHSTTSGGYTTTSWYNITAGANFGSMGQSSCILGNTGQPMSPCEAIITPSVSITVAMKVLTTNGSGTMTADFTGATITQLGTSSVIDMVAATASAAGVKGTVAAPAAGQHRSLWTGSGWNDAGWTSYTPTITGSTTNPTLATTKTLIARYRVVGKNLEIAFTYYAAATTGAANGSGTYKISLPSGFTIDTTVAPLVSTLTCAANNYNGAPASSLGIATVQTSASSCPGVVVGATNTEVCIFLGTSTYPTQINTTWGSDNYMMTVASNLTVKLTASIPIT